jgi:ketosteroid isomerase-like protein
MRSLFSLIAVLVLASSLLFSQAPDNPAKAADLAFAQATRDRGLEGWMSFFADDSYVGTKPSVQGKEEVRKFYQGFFARRELDIAWTPTQAEVFPSGVMGYTTGRYKMSFTNYQGSRIVDAGSYVTVWQKQPDGNWKVLANFRNQDKPSAEPPKVAQ